MEKAVGSRDQGNDAESDLKRMTGCATSAVMPDGEISRYRDNLLIQGVAQGYTAVSPNIFKINSLDLKVAVEAAK